MSKTWILEGPIGVPFALSGYGGTSGGSTPDITLHAENLHYKGTLPDGSVMVL